MEQRLENEELYKVVKIFHEKEELPNVCTQHPHLLPKLRPYQEKAVQWMVHRETQPVIENQLLDYVSTEQTPSGSSGTVNSLHVSRIPTGGILSDEMGLGKTVEVLACILINQRSFVKTRCVVKDSSSEDEYADLDPAQIAMKAAVNKEERERRAKRRLEVKETATSRSKQDHVLEESSPDDELEEVTLKKIVVKAALNKEQRAERQLKAKDPVACASSSGAGLENLTTKSAENCDGAEVDLGFAEAEYADQDREKIKLESREPVIHEKSNIRQIVEAPTILFNQENVEQDGLGLAAVVSEETCEEVVHDVSEEKVECATEMSSFFVSEANEMDSIKVANRSRKRKIKSKYDDPLWEVNLKKSKPSATKRKARTGNVNPDCDKSTKKRPQQSASKLLAQAWYESKLSEVKQNPIRAYRKTIEESEDYNRNIEVQCICGETNRGHLIKCDECSRLLHKKCIGASRWIGVKPVYCPQCWLKQTPVPSRATLIVSPKSISGQWLNEVKKHISPKAKFKVLFYNGVKKNGFSQPYEYSKYDLILTTYDVLRRELDLAEVHEGRRMRYEKRYFTPTCPLLCIDFWRICLDEAQMVEGHATKAAEMVSRLTSVHRWAVTGTPIQKSLQDLYGLVMFLRIEPFCDLKVWERDLLDPHCDGDKNPFFTLFAHVMWRSSKADVLDQIQIPPQSELIWSLNFSPVEEHFYLRTHQECATEFLQKLSQFDSLDIQLQSLKLVIVNKVLTPLLKLRQACSHPQAVRGNVITNQQNTMTMPELLESLIKKTTFEAQDALRKHIAALNGLAGLHIIAHEYVSAVENYREVLRITEDFKDRVKVDTLQKIHTLDNLAQIIASHRGIIPPTLRDDQLHDECKKLEENYLSKAQLLVSSVNANLVELTENVDKCKLGAEGDHNWWYEVLGHLERDELLNRVHDALVNHRKSLHDVSSTSIINNVNTIGGLQLAVNRWLENLEKHELDAKKRLQLLKAADCETLMNKAVECHLRISNLKSKFFKRSCELCLCEDTLKKYEIDLFDIKIKKNENTLVGDVYLLGEGKEGSWKPSEQETVLKTVLTMGRQRKVGQDLLKAGARFFKLMIALRKEFKPLRLLWSRINEMTQARDELNMCKLRLRLRLPHEEINTNTTVNKRKKQPNVSKQLSSNLDTKLENLHIIDPHQVEQMVHQNKIEAVWALSELRKKSGTVAYLQNLRQKGEDDSKSFIDVCPVCQSTLEKRWAVLSCGHCYCMDCIPELFKKKEVQCAVCREKTLINEVSFVNSSPNVEEDVAASTQALEVPSVVGFHSTKVEAIVKRIFYLRAADPSVKVLIFSTWDRVLNVLEEALHQNGVRNLRLKPGINYEKTLKLFKTLELQDTDEENTVTALLLLLKLGSKGLNLTEATHVMLVEPLLNPADELQAIGRVHRIGQTRPTFVHRFLIKDTIEDRMFSAVKVSGKEQWSEKQVTLQQLKDLFSSSSNVVPEAQE